jgi:phosphate transport system protein
MQARVHTDRRFEEDLKMLHQSVLEMGGFVEKQIINAVDALVRRDSDAARRTIDQDHTVNRMDVEIDDMSLRILALHQPAARDLRFITTALKITTDLERIGDMAVNICERVLELNEEPQLKPYIDIPRLADIAQRMLRESLDAFVREDTDLALKVCAEDDTIDALNNQLFRELLSYMAENPRTVTRATRLLFISKYLERIADHATNIAEMVVFMVKGKSIRHLDHVPETV